MNITHVQSEQVQGDMLQAIFNRQKELMNKYHHIEVKSGLLQTEDCPVNLDDKRGQARLKDFAWRTTEELAEALDTMREDGEEDNLHFMEELVDALHFFTELTILSGHTPDDIATYHFSASKDRDILSAMFAKAYYMIDICEYQRPISRELMEFIIELGMMCNTLKNKPWKQSQMVTDKGEFRTRLMEAWLHFIMILCAAGLDAETTCDLYLKKSQVNKFRQRTNY